MPSRWAITLGLLTGSRSILKDNLAGWVAIDPATLPYRQDLLDWLGTQRQAGRRIILATATHETVARQIADHLGIVDDVVATTRDTNLKGPAKAQRLRELYGENGFEYVGNDTADVPVWEAAQTAHVAGNDQRLSDSLRRAGKLGRVFDIRNRPVWESWAKALRLHQWLKNLLVLAPIAGAHRFDDFPTWVSAVLAFVCFGTVASSVYVLNDLADVDDDRRHHRKRYRPFAAGDLPLSAGWAAWPLLSAIGLSVAATALPTAFTAVLGLYFVLTLAYSFSWKRL
ncbi:MAG: UbiA family prenyltransferase, partial [Armatimonadaceae bacterium]